MKKLGPSVLLLALLACAAHAADERPADFAQSATITAPAGASHYRVAASEAVYRASQKRGLADLRVANAAGEFVPFAIVQSGGAGALERESVPAKLFPLHGDEAKGMEGLSLRIERNAAGTVVQVHSDGKAAPGGRKLLGYLAALPTLARAGEAIVFEWEAPAGFTGSATVEASEDLKRWSLVAAQAPVVLLEHGGERLEQKRVELSPLRAKYLRLSFRGVPAGFALRSASVQLQPATPETPRAAIAITGRADAEKKHEYLFDTGGVFPVDRLRFALPQVNAVAPVQVFSRERGDAPWRPVASTVAYRLAKDGGEMASPEIAFAANADRYWMVRVDARSGGLGAGDLGLKLGWIPHEVVFAARGAGPFVLLAGSRAAASAALPVGTILPGHREGAPLEVVEARLGPMAANPAVATAAPKAPAESVQAYVESPEGRKNVLWGVLVLGVLFVIWMATRLMREMGGRSDGNGAGK